MLSGNEFVGPYEQYKLAKPGVRHVSVGADARKTLIVGNIINAGVLNVTRASRHDGTIVVANNVDDSQQDPHATSSIFGGTHDTLSGETSTSDCEDGAGAIAELRSKVERLETLVALLLDHSK